METYYDLCERWWRNWLASGEAIAPPTGAGFDPDAAPEPYLLFEPGERPLVVLTTNPGAPMEHQYRSNVLSGRSMINPVMKYSEAAQKLAHFYATQLKGIADQRVAAQRDLALASGYSGILQAECCPWHSISLPDKRKLMGTINADHALLEYTSALREFLIPFPVVGISAVSSQASITLSTLQLSEWLKWKCEMIGLRPAESEVIPLVQKGERVTSAALVDRSRGIVKSLILMMGGNHLPAAPGRKILAGKLSCKD